MKKVFTLCVAIMASAATFAQTTLWNGEDKELGKEAIGFWPMVIPKWLLTQRRTASTLLRNV